MPKWVYRFGGGSAEGKSEMRNLLGGKGANLAEMANLGLPVPPGFTITTEVCTYFYAHGKKYPDELAGEIDAALAHVGKLTGRSFGDNENPLLVSVRSGARASMPGMMDTVLNLGLNDTTVKALAKNAEDERFAYDSYRRFIQMYSGVVLGVEHHNFEEVLDLHKSNKGHELDTDLSAQEWRDVITDYKALVERETGKPFPQDPREQLWGAIGAVFGSWMNQRAITYRRLHNIPESWAPRSTCRRWCLAIWVRPRRRALPSRAILRQATGSCTASSWSMRRARTSLPVSARRRTSPKQRVSPLGPTSRRWKR